ncbi:MAG: hypothetical protein HQL37_08615 [Alphaproteobacteria bacterium]|nr:hypothetical protein [Alphaproteobacteria bacterium]
MRIRTIWKAGLWPNGRRFDGGVADLHAATLVILLALTAALWAGVWFVVVDERNGAVHLAESNVTNLARSFEENARRTIGHIDTILLTLRTFYLDDEADFGRLCETRFHSLLGDPILQISVIGPSGFLKFSNQSKDPAPVYFGDRLHFTVHRTSDRDDLFISPPVRGRISNQVTLQFTRKILDRSGHFAGVMVVSMPPALFSEFYKSIDIGPGGVIALVGMDRIIRARTSITGDSLDALGVRQPADRPYFDPDKPGSGISYVQSVVDGVTRLTAYRRLETYPLVVLVQMAQAEIFAGVDQQAALLAGGAVFGTILIVATCVVVLRLLLRQRANAAELTRVLTLNLRAEMEKVEVAEARATAERQQTELQRNRVTTISHEFRTPLTVIDGHAQYLLAAGPQAAELAKPRLDAIRTAVRRILGLVEGILLSDQIESDLFDFQLGRVDIDTLVADICRSHREASPDHEIFFTDPAARLPVSGDGKLLRYAFDNLLTNACKYSPPRSTIEVEARLDGGSAVITVRDQGIGIPADEIGRLFERYFRASNAYRFPGNGVGLHFAHTIVSRHGGALTANSVLGAGSTFTVRLPLEHPPAEEPPDHGRAPAVH